VKFAVALKEALKYHAIAFVPNLIGGGIVAVTLWIGVIDPAIAALPGAAGGPEGMLESLLAAQYNIPVVLIGVIGGVGIRRLGKTALLFKIHGTAVVDVVDDELIEDEADSTHSTGDSDHRSTSESDDTENDDIESDDTESDTAAVDAERGDEPTHDTTDATDTRDTTDTTDASVTTDATDTTTIDSDGADSETDRQDTEINHDDSNEEDVSR